MCEKILWRTIKVNDNAMKFYVQGGGIPLEMSKSIMGAALDGGCPREGEGEGDDRGARQEGGSGEDPAVQGNKEDRVATDEVTS